MVNIDYNKSFSISDPFSAQEPTDLTSDYDHGLIRGLL